MEGAWFYMICPLQRSNYGLGNRRLPLEETHIESGDQQIIECGGTRTRSQVPNLQDQEHKERNYPFGLE